MFYFPNKNSQ